ncbi:APC family permease [Mucilaginibacter boryungensis]|uniref:APC family permease n=1 Tax=Mucilaginibacter boryungensis TaxID=768480 RepID=A0ABR9XNK2_9SPHI|nr:APC family permease [Mucilaginibacter boryungensis]MBE9668620.1 APC family permease [Mucilaginibacter boryungensis]
MPAEKKHRKIRPLQLIAVIFFTVSGGPYGLEPLLGYVHQHGALLLLLVTPILWDIPAIFTVLELNGMMPVTGGYYQWVKHALGKRWGFYEGWWTWLYTFADLAIYPVLFIQYAAFFFPGIETYKIPVCLVIVWSSAALNIWGIVPVGRVALALSVVVLLPFIILFAVFAQHHTGGFLLPAPSLKGIAYPSLGLGIYTVMWNCFGWDNVTTYAEEVEKPERAYFVSIFLAFILVMVIYCGVIITALLSGIDYTVFANEGLPALGTLINGRWLGSIIAIAGLASTLGLYAANLLSVSRLPKVMADDQFLPTRLHSLHPRFNTPYVSIIVCSVVISLMCFWSFGDLLIIDVTVYGAGLFLEYISLIKLRLKEPHRERPFRIPLSTRWLCIFLVLPITVYGIALSGVLSSMSEALKPALFALAALLSGELVWRLIMWRKPHLRGL